MKNKRPTFSRLKRYLLAGLGAILPLFVTVYVIVVLFKFADSIAGKYVNSYLLKYYGFKIPGLGLVIVFLVIIAAGIVSSHFIGRKLFPFFEGLLLRVPLIADIYPSVRQLSNFFFKTDDKGKYKKAVLVCFPVEWSLTIGFITNESLESLNREAGQRLISVFVPFAPTPFSGIVLLLPPERIKPVEIPFEEAIKFIVSGGVIAPEIPPTNQPG